MTILLALLVIAAGAALVVVLSVNRGLAKELSAALASEHQLREKLAWFDQRHDDPVEVVTRWSAAELVDGEERHYTAMLEWDFRSGHSVPWDAVNAVLSKHYNQGNLPWFYAWWDRDSEQRGILITPTLDLERMEVTAIAEQIGSEPEEADSKWRTTRATLDA